MITRICLDCKKEMQLDVYHLRQLRCQVCSYEHNKQQTIEYQREFCKKPKQGRPVRNRLLKTCKMCGKVFEERKTASLYCSNDCYHKTKEYREFTGGKVKFDN